MLGFLRGVKDKGHRYCQQNLSALLDGQISPRDEERLRRHLEQCEECQWDLRTLERTVALVRALPRVKAPRSFQIAPTVPAPSLPFWMRPWAYGALRAATGVAAALLVVALAGYALAPPRDVGQPAMLMASEPAGAAAMVAPEEAAADRSRLPGE
ncbi:MAG: zf-HC2 domain-containing protein, partial [Anaerolineae bacterium]|nr:zf-HC2 domain-containing protein [Anaerolineae bacterium]